MQKGEEVATCQSVNSKRSQSQRSQVFAGALTLVAH